MHDDQALVVEANLRTMFSGWSIAWTALQGTLFGALYLLGTTDTGHFILSRVFG